MMKKVDYKETKEILNGKIEFSKEYLERILSRAKMRDIL